MTGTDLALAVAIAVLIAGAGFFAVTETSLTRMTPTRAAALVSEGRRGAPSLRNLVAHPGRFLNTVLLLALACQLVAATLVGVLANRHFAASGVAIVTTAEVVVVFVLAEAAPKSWAVLHGDRAALLTAPLAGLLARATPLRVLSTGLVNVANAILPGRQHSRGPLVLEAELLATADAAAADKTIETEERELIHSVIAFGDTIAREVMVPRTDMVTVDASSSIPEALEVVASSTLSRLPAIERDTDHIVGLVYAKDLLVAVSADEDEGPVRRLLRPAPVVPETKPVAELLREMQAGRYHMVILTDEYGGTAGLVTIEDLIEELVGEIEDEFDTSQRRVQPLPGGGAQLSGRLPVAELARLFDIQPPEGAWVTVGGMVTGLLGRIPAEGESVEIDGYTLGVQRMERHRVRRVVVTPTSTSDA